MFSFLSGGRHRYAPLKHEVSPSSFSDCFRSRPFLIVLSLFLSLSCFYLGRVSGNAYPTVHSEPNLSRQNRIFEYQRLFGEHPSPSSDSAWLHLFPEYGGFFKHPILAEERSAFSVFHQLHCLNGIRQGYWALYDTARSGVPFDESSLPMMGQPPHIRHCIDLLRQTLMCNPDLTIELKDEAIGGVRGFGTEHQCSNWEQLKAWTRQWQNWNHEEGDGESGHEGHVHDER